MRKQDRPEESREELGHEDMADAREQIRRATALIQPLLDARIPTYAVLGNHDYAMQWPNSLPLVRVADELAAALRMAGVRVLRIEALPLDTGSAGGALYLVGLDAAYPGRARPREALAQVPHAPRGSC